VWEHTNKANMIDGSNYNNGQTSVAWTWCASYDWWAQGTNWCWASSIYRSTYGPITAWWTDKWFWNVRYPQWVASNIFLRGGGALDAASAGIFALHLTWTATTQSSDVGFRCSL
jgi:hypothetical protein